MTISKIELAKRTAFITPEARAQQDSVHKTVGSFMAMWANVESLLVAVLGILLDTSHENAQIVYAGLNTVHARRRTITALARQNLDEPECDRLLSLIKAFKSERSLRDSFAHCEYILNDKFCYVAMAHYDLDNLEVGKKLVEFRQIDKKLEINQSIRRLASIYDGFREIANNFQRRRP